VKNDTFNDRLIFFLIHFAFFLRAFKNKDNSKVLQEIYDYCFKQLELSIREIGYGDQSINKKMKDYINLFHSIISEINDWESFDISKKIKTFRIFLTNSIKINDLIEYFDFYYGNLKKKNLNSYLKSVRS